MSEAHDATAVGENPGLARTLVAWRTELGLSGIAAARRLGVAHTTLRSWEVDGVCPQPLQLRLVAEALGVDTDAIRTLSGPDRIRTIRTSGGHDASPLCLARLAVGLTMTQLAIKVQVAPTTVSRWENGLRAPSPAARARLAQALRSTPEELTVMLAGAPPRRSDGVLLPGLGQLRRDRGFTQRDFRSAVGIGATTANAWEHGRVRVPTDHLAAVASVLRMDVRAVLAVATRPPKNRTGERPLTGLRRAAGLTQRELAHHLRVSVRSVVHWEAGTRPLPASSGPRLARLLGVPLRTLLRAAGHEPLVLAHPSTWTTADLPKVLATLRRNAGWSAASLGRRLGTSALRIRSWETGGALPSPSACGRLELVYGLSHGILTGLIPQPPEQTGSRRPTGRPGVDDVVSSPGCREGQVHSVPFSSART